MITQNEKHTLEIAAHKLSEGHWVIGDTAIEILDRLEDKYTRQEILREVGKICDLSWRRVDKIVAVCLAFPERDGYGFGYYERAYDFGPDANDAIEYLSFFQEEFGRVPAVSEFPMLFKQHILGGDVTPPSVDPPPDEILLQVRVLRRMISERYPKLLDLVDVLEKALSASIQ